MVWRLVLIIAVFLVIAICSISPFLVSMAAGTVGDHYGCQVDEGSIHPCIVNGEDIGDTLYTLGVLGWLGIATIPIGMAALGIYLLILIVIGIITWVRKARKKKKLAEVIANE